MTPRQEGLHGPPLLDLLAATSFVTGTKLAPLAECPWTGGTPGPQAAQTNRGLLRARWAEPPGP